MMRPIALIPLMVSLAVLSSGCGGTDEQSSAGTDGGGAGTCALTVEFDNRYYTAGGDLPKTDKGRRLGTAAPVPCSGQDADGPPESDLTLYAIQGVDPSEAVLAVSPVSGDPIALVVEAEDSE